MGRQSADAGIDLEQRAAVRVVHVDARRGDEQAIERVARDTERDRYMTAIQAKEYGMVDEVVGHIPAAEANKPPVG